MKSSPTPAAWLQLALLVLGLTALSCSSEEPLPTVSVEPAATASGKLAAAARQPSLVPSRSPEHAAAGVAAIEPKGDAERGKTLVRTFECARCHDGLDEVPQIASASHCTKCHQDVMEGRFDHKADSDTWRKNVAHLVAVPSLEAAGQRLNYRWLVQYLLEPHDLRPRLTYDMPRLALDRAQARDVATYLTRRAKGESQSLDLAGADLNAGKKLLAAKGCGSCHTMSRTDAFTQLPRGPFTQPPLGQGELRLAVMLAPDLRHARQRLRPDAIMAWLENPLKMKPGTLMPQTPMSDQEARNIVAYLFAGPVQPFTPPPLPVLPDALDREVGFDEIDEKIFSKICRHCHGDPDQAVGDGGPGNTGGFGFKARGLELTSFKRVMAGYTDDAGERHSVFAPTDNGTPRILASLMARHGEVLGLNDPEIRGMPLGLPPLPLADIQLLLTWIKQGRRR